jgi:hypothetical protein
MIIIAHTHYNYVKVVNQTMNNYLVCVHNITLTFIPYILHLKTHVWTYLIYTKHVC